MSTYTATVKALLENDVKMFNQSIYSLNIMSINQSVREYILFCRSNSMKLVVVVQKLLEIC